MQFSPDPKGYIVVTRVFRAGYAVVLLLIFAASVNPDLTLAQGDNPGPLFSFWGTDAGCVNSSDCDIVGGCTEYPFTPSVTGQYQYFAWGTCTSGDCSDCVSCVRLYEGMPPYTIISCGTDVTCASGVCRHQCQNVSLIGGRPYILKVCLLSCAAMNLCEGSDFCTAHGCITNTGQCQWE